MTPEQTAASYDKLATFWNSDELDRNNGIAQHKRAIQFIASKGHAIDIGCGSSGRIIDLMLAEGFEVEGLDISAEMIRIARERHPSVPFHLADISLWELPRKYALISAWDSIWHAPLADHEAILTKLCQGLASGGVLIFTSGGVDQPEGGASSFLDQPLYHAALGIPKLLEIITREECICRHLEYDQHPELHVYLIVQKSV